MTCSSQKAKIGTYIFTRDQTAYLINLYQQYHLLYEPANENYKNKTRRTMALKAITEDFNKNFALVNISVDEIRKKINSLRTQFFGEVNKIKKSMVSGAGAADIYNSSLWCFEHLSFLNTSNPIRSSESNLNIEPINQDEDESELIFDGTIEELGNREIRAEMQAADSLDTSTRPSTSSSFRSDDLQTPSMKKRKYRSSQDSKAVTLMEKATSLLESTNKTSKDDLDTIDTFIMSVGSEIRQIKSPVRCRLLRRKIMNLIHETIDEEEREEEV